MGVSGDPTHRADPLVTNAPARELEERSASARAMVHRDVAEAIARRVREPPWTPFRRYALAARDTEGIAAMKVVDLATQSPAILEQAARMLVEEFGEPAGWPDLDSAREEVARVLDEGFALAAIEDATLIGWIGGLPEYAGRVWELHPMVVRQSHRRRGFGRRLVAAFEEEARGRGALTVTLGTDDDSGMTSLADVDLYDDLPRHLSQLQDRGRGHPFRYYQSLGYVVSGVLPDANGRGRPDIYLSKAIWREGERR